ncbi:MAG: metalloregulator ArsR/SmtB family transcription factor [Bacteroidales bacterium]|nr:metalloregulator ArsR/SmtB family transcription factor [Bacteroidales bacterium]
MEICLNKEEMEYVAYILKALSNANRLMILAVLAKNHEMNVSDICEKLECTQPLISHHLTDMQSKGILKMRREGRNIIYSLENQRVIDIIHCVADCKK